MRKISRKNWLTTLVLSIFLGMFGIHRFYAGKIRSGILWFLTLGLCGFGWAADFFIIATGGFTDGYGFPIVRRKNDAAKTNGPKLTIILVGILLAFLSMCAFILLCEWSFEPEALCFAVPCFLMLAAYTWYFIVPKLLKEAGYISSESVDEFFNPFKEKRDHTIPKPEGSFLGYAESVDGMYAEHYDAMQLYNNLLIYLEDYPREREFDLGPVHCRQYMGKSDPVWKEALYLKNMSGGIALLVYNDSRNIYTFKKGQWYVNRLPLSEQEPELQYII